MRNAFIFEGLIFLASFLEDNQDIFYPGSIGISGYFLMMKQIPLIDVIFHLTVFGGRVCGVDDVGS